jgi:hypothetical protein
MDKEALGLYVVNIGFDDGSVISKKIIKIK